MSNTFLYGPVGTIVGRWSLRTVPAPARREKGRAHARGQGRQHERWGGAPAAHDTTCVAREYRVGTPTATAGRVRVSDGNKNELAWLP